MKKNLIFTLLYIISFFCTAQQVIEKKYESNVLQSIRNLKIHLPYGYDKDSTSNYPLAIVIDASYLFDNYVANAALFAATDKAPKQIIVGIHIDKTREEDTAFNTKNFKLTSGNTKFIEFIRSELVPYIEGSYRTSPFLTIVGQGTATNIAIALLKEKNPIFNAYVNINPVFSPITTQKITNTYNLRKLKKIDNTFYIYMNELPYFNKEQKRVLLELQTYIGSIHAKNINFILDKMNSPNYTSAMSETIPRAINTIFEKYARITKKEYEEKIKKMPPLEAIAYLENKYLDIDFLFGANLGIREKDIYAIEDVIIDKEDGHYLKDFGKMILNVYPKSHIGNYYIGLWHEKKGDTAMALKSYKEAYGKMNDADPNKELFYKNIERLGGL